MRTFIVFLLFIPYIAKCQFRNNFLGTYTGVVDAYDVGHVTLFDQVFVNPSATDTNNIVITDSVSWLNFEYVLYPDSTFIFLWDPTFRYGYFYSNGDSIFVHDVHNNPYYREWHCGKAGAGVNEISNSPFSIYPSPARNKIYILTDKPFNNLQLKLFNSVGQSVLEKSVSQFQNTIEISLPTLPDGIYFIKIQSQNNFFCQKIIIQN